MLDNFYSPVDPYWDKVPEGFVLIPGEFSAIGRMEKLRQLSVVLSSRDQILDMGNFFINREDLLRRDFSRILYNWDCC